MAHKNFDRLPHRQSGNARAKSLFVGATMVLACLPPVARAQDIEAGKTVFKKCAACHSADTDANKVGPTLKGVVGGQLGPSRAIRTQKP